jgi:hypothetical protein
MDPLFDAILGYRIRRGGYMKRSAIEGQMATRDLAQLAALGLLEAHGSGRGRYYVASQILRDGKEEVRTSRPPVEDPYPWMRPRLAEPIVLQR